MEHVIGTHGISKVLTDTAVTEGVHLVSVFIHHRALPAHMDHLCKVIEQLALDAVIGWSS